jgi:hypothetical protein
MRKNPSYLFSCSVFSLVLWLVPLHAYGRSSIFTYSAAKASVSSLSLDPVNGEIHIHDRGYAARFFSDQQFFAIESEIMEIAIPKRMSAEQWVYAGKSYKNLGKSTAKWIGKSLDIYRITVNAVDAEIIAIYNVRLGVIGFEFVDGGITKKIFLRGRCGYAALGCY